MAGVGICFLHLAWFLSWFGTFATTCTGSDPKSLAAGTILSLGPYLVSVASLHFGRLNFVGLVLSLPIVLLLARQAFWGAQLFVVVNVNGRSACSHMFWEEFGPSRGGWFEQIYGPYYFLIGVASIIAVVYSAWRYEEAQKKMS